MSTKSWNSCQADSNKRRTLGKIISHLLRRLSGYFQAHSTAAWLLATSLLLILFISIFLQSTGRFSHSGHTPFPGTTRAASTSAELLFRFESSCQPDQANTTPGEVSKSCPQAAHLAITGIPYSDFAGETRLLRWLAIHDPQAFAGALDQALVPVPEGSFEMGSETGRADERPVRSVTLGAFSIDRYEVTNVQYARFLAANGRKPPRYWIDGAYPPGLAASPVVGVSWQDAADYCTWAGKRLPTEAEWEKACRGTDERIFPWGDDWHAADLNLTEACLVPGSQYLDALWPVLQTAPGPGQAGLYPVGSFPQGASPYGVLDMAGNVSEWVKDWYNPKAYQVLAEVDPFSLEPPWNHSLRGSAWWVFPKSQADTPGSTGAFESRCAARAGSHSADDPRVGFRCSR